MTIPTFAAARTTDKMVSREDELKVLEKAVCQPGPKTRVIIIKGQGGLGKTRLLFEALRRAGHPGIFPARIPLDSSELWNNREAAIVSDLLDFTEVRLHTFHDFMEALRNSFSWNEHIEFPGYDAAITYYKRKLTDQADYFTVQRAAEAANEAFFEDYKRLTKQYRLVWGLDTTEQLRYAGAPWLLKKGLLSTEDLNFGTRQQIFRLVTSGELPNTTLILVGRPEASDYFK